MKNRFIAVFAVLILTVAGSLSASAFAQTADDGSGPSEQPSAPMEMGQEQPSDQPPDQAYDGDASDAQSADAQPTEAQPGGPSGEAPAQTDQGVARISMIHGDVSTQRGDSGDWSAATLNQPVMTGDKVSTGNDARTELQLDFANILRLGPNSQANVANLTQKNIQIQLGQGIANYTVSKDSEAEPEIDTPNVSVHPSHHDGVFRIEVRPDGDTIVIVRKGELQIATPQGSTEVREGEMATVRGTSDSAQYKVASAPDRDDWDRWNSDRDHTIQNASSWRHTNKYYTGAQDLDAYGKWRNVPDYGDVWVPNESEDWAPYRDGNWVWEPSYGWTWVGYEPWGWAPYHYGRWFPYENSWAWWPGPVYGGGFYRPFWAPAYVSFWGWGGGWGFSAGYGGWGGFGWLPVGPCDWYHPWWGGYRNRFGVVNVTNIRINNFNRYGGMRPLHGGNRFSNVSNIHNNHVFRAMSTVNAGHFGAGRMRPVAATRQQLNGARMMAGNLPVVPTRASLSASGRAAAPTTVRNGGSQRFFGAHNNTVRPASFQQQTASLRQTMQQQRVGAVPAGGRFARESANARGTGQKPNAGTSQGGRQMNSPGNRAASNGAAQSGNRSGYSPYAGQNNRSARDMGTTSSSNNGRASEPVNRGGYRPFTPPSNNGTRSVAPNSGTSRGSEPVNRGGYRPSNTPSNNSERAAAPPNSGNSRTSEPVNRGGFRPFTPPSENSRSSSPQQRAPETTNRGGYRPFTPPSSQASRGQSSAPPSHSNSGGYWNRTAPSSQMHTNGPVYGGSERGSSRPPLDMRQPIVRGPSSGGSARESRPSYGGYGGSRGAAPPSYSAPRSAPSYGGGGRYSPPSGGGGHYSAPSGGGHYSAPSGGGGGHYSAPSGGGGGHYSAPSGGGGHSSGGGGGHSSGGHSSGGRR